VAGGEDTRFDGGSGAVAFVDRLWNAPEVRSAETKLGVDAAAPGAFSPRAWALVLGLTAAFALLRLYDLGAWGLWVDEAHTLHDATSPGAPPLSGQQFPLGYLVVRLALELHGGAADEWVLRLPSALFGVLGILLTAWAFAPVVGRQRAAVAALLVAASGWHLYWSQTARAYTLMQDLSLLGAGLYLRGLARGRPALVIGGLALGTLAIFAHPSAALLLPGWVLAPLVLPYLRVPLPKDPPRLALSVLGAVGLIVLGGWAIRVWIDYQDAKGGASTRHFALTTGWYLGPLLALGAGVGGALAALRRRPFDLLIALVCLVTLGAAVAASGYVLVAAQYVFCLLPWIAVLASVPFGPGADGRATLRHAWLALLVLPGLVDMGLYFGPRHGNRPRWREAYAHVWNERGPHDLVFGMAAPVGEYYLAPRRDVLRQHRALIRLDPYTNHLPPHWSRRGRTIWFVLRREDLAAWGAERRAAFLAMLDRECRLELELPVRWTPRDLTVQVWVREQDGVP
jgi:hypothetical protein